MSPPQKCRFQKPSTRSLSANRRRLSMRNPAFDHPAYPAPVNSKYFVCESRRKLTVHPQGNVAPASVRLQNGQYHFLHINAHQKTRIPNNSFAIFSFLPRITRASTQLPTLGTWGSHHHSHLVYYIFSGMEEYCDLTTGKIRIIFSMAASI